MLNTTRARSEKLTTGARRFDLTAAKAADFSQLEKNSERVKMFSPYENVKFEPESHKNWENFDPAHHQSFLYNHQHQSYGSYHGQHHQLPMHQGTETNWNTSPIHVNYIMNSNVIHNYNTQVTAPAQIPAHQVRIFRFSVILTILVHLCS